MTRHLHRRQFLTHVTTTALVACTAAHGLQAARADATARRVTVGAHPWVYAAKQPNYDITPILEQIFSDMKYAGLDAIELMHNVLLPDDAVSRLSDLSHKHELPILGTSFDGQMWNREQHAEILKTAERFIPRLAQLGGRTLGISVGATGSKKTPAQLDAQADLLRKLIALCEAHQVVPNLHNHTYEVVDDLHDLRGTLERIPTVKLGPDLDWLVQAGVDPVKFLREFGDRIVFLHLRDQKADKTWVESLGEGQMDYAAIHDALEAIHFSGDAVIELAHPKDLTLTRPLRESLKLSRQFVRDKLGY
jgi:sugar phosphate isomerase/epimerase